MTQVNISSSSQHPKLAFIGAGNMARAIIGGLLNTGYPADHIWASEPKLSKLDDLKAKGLNTTSDNAEVIQAADIIVLAVKPQILKDVLLPLKAVATKHSPLFISVAAGITSESIDQWLGGNQAIVRCMPNTPSLVSMGASGLCANPQVTTQQKTQAEAVLASVGTTVWVDDENLLHAITAVSGSGPAYYFLFMEAMIAAGVKQGLPLNVATELTLQTARGAAEMAATSDVDPAELRRRVSSPKGTTEQAIMSFQANGLEKIVDTAMQACAERSKELAKLLAE